MQPYCIHCSCLHVLYSIWPKNHMYTVAYVIPVRGWVYADLYSACTQYCITSDILQKNLHNLSIHWTYFGAEPPTIRMQLV